MVQDVLNSQSTFDFIWHAADRCSWLSIVEIAVLSNTLSYDDKANLFGGCSKSY